MKIINLSTDEAILRELGQRLAAQRLRRNLTQMQLAEQAGISKSTLQRLESGEAATQLSGFVRVCRALGLLEQFEALLPEPAPSPMAQLKLQGRQRQRATGGKATQRARKKWTWGDPA
jgi:transcriptional regulator with XRE-family HTH domain